MDDIKKEFWGDLQADLYVQNTAVYLANQRLENLISTTGYKAHRPILSHPQVGTYTPYSDIDFEEKTAETQSLSVDTFEYSAEEIDITDKKQTPYDLVNQSLTSIRHGLLNRIEQKYLSEIGSAQHSISGSPVTVTGANILDILEEAEGKLGSFDAPYETGMRAAVLGPRTVAKLRRNKGERETNLGDSVLANGVVGPWLGWTVVQNNNLPWSATLTIDTEPADGDTVVILGVTFTFKTTLGTTAGQVLIGANVAAARANLKLAVEKGAGAGTNYVELGIKDRFLLTRKRNIACTSVEAMAFTGYGDISVSETFTADTNVWSSEIQKDVFMIRGSIDLVIQFIELKVGDKQAGFADLPKGLIGVGAETFDDGAVMMVELEQDVSSFS